MLKRIILSILMLGFVTQAVSVKAENANSITQEQFRGSVTYLSQPLKDFLKDFQMWTQEEKNTIQISVPTINFSGITVTGLNRERQDSYEGDLASWLNKRVYEMASARGQINPTILYKINLAYLKDCIEYLRQ